MTEIILSQWVIASALGALCLGLLLFCLLPAVVIVARLRSMGRTMSAMRTDVVKAKDVHDLKQALERLAERQIEASSRQQELLGQQLSNSLRDPLQGVVRSLESFGRIQNEQVAHGLRDQMTAFADRLDQLLGGQVAQAKELQGRTLKSLETTIAAFQDMARSLGTTTEGATSAMVKELRAGIARSLAETNTNASELIRKLSAEVASAVKALEQQTAATGKLAIEHQRKISEEAQEAMEALSSEVRAQTQAIDLAAQSMRSIGTDVGHAVDRIIEGMTGLISGAAQEIMRSGQGFTEIFEKSSVLSRDLTETAAALAASSKDISGVVNDYRSARETLQSLIDLIRSTAETARGDASPTAAAVARIEAAAQKLVAAQGQADEHLAKLNGVLSEVHTAFSAQMLQAVREFQEHLMRASPQQPMPEELRRRHSELDRMISDWVQTTPRLKQGKPPAPPPPASPSPATPAVATATLAPPAPPPPAAPPPTAPRQRITLQQLVTAKARK
jgi:ABC-type transporter Mla subunit MlaD